MDILNTRFARWVLTILIAFQAGLSFFGLVLPLSYRLGLTANEYRRLIPLVEAMPAGLLGLSAISGVLYLTAAWLLLRRRATSFLAFAAALAISLIHWSIATRIPAYYPYPTSQLVLPPFMMGMLWEMLRQSRTLLPHAPAEREQGSKTLVAQVDAQPGQHRRREWDERRIQFPDSNV